MKKVDWHVLIDKNKKIPLYRQLGDALFTLITEETAEGFLLESGMKLPPIRALSKALGVNNQTVVAAYRYLENKGVVYSVTGSGTFVKRPEKNLGDYLRMLASRVDSGELEMKGVLTCLKMFG